MTNIFPPLFTRLYISLLAALFASVLLTFYLSEQFLERSDVIDFYDDSFQTFAEISADMHRSGLSAQQLLLTPIEYDASFDVRWQENWNIKQHCSTCDFLSKIAGTSIYKLTDDQLLAVYPLSQGEGAILISDKQANSVLSPRASRQHDDSLFVLIRNDPAEVVPYLLLLVVVVVIGTTLYFSVRKLQAQINQLVQINQRFGKGELSIRAPQDYTEPVNELAHSFNKMADSITETVNENQIFAQAVPHEMRTPLSRIQLATGLLRQRKQQAEELALLDNIDNYIDDIDKLTRQVMTFSKLNAEQTAQEPKKCSPIQLDEYIQSRIQHLRVNNDIDIVATLPNIQLDCDSAYLRLMFDNIFSNALRYAFSQVKVTVKVNQALPSLINLTIEDDGIGIEEQNFTSVFLPFYRIDKSRNLETGGLGLGLAIAKAAAARMRCNLKVSKSKLGGACFSCDLSNIS